MQRLLLSPILSGILSDMGLPCDFRVMLADDSQEMFADDSQVYFRVNVLLDKLEYLVIMILSKR